jgi:Carboxypeptidase regulatory-like domain
MRSKETLMAGLAILAAAMMTSGVSGGGMVSGKVSFEGTPSKPTKIDLSPEPSCAKLYPSKQITSENIVTGPNNVLENVVVYISAGAPDDPAPAEPAKLTQKGCRYVPHVLAFQVNQPLEIVNEDQTSHNVHPLPKFNREWNKSQPPGTPPIVDKYGRPEFIPVKCNIHPWMRANFAVVKNSHFAITGSDGDFSLPNLPPGKYTITAWHESFGEQTQEVTITGGETKTLNFVFKAKPY